jgi:hypothetical protein
VPQPHGDNGRQAALPAAGTGEFLRLRRMGMTPRRRMIVMIVAVVSAAGGAVRVLVFVRVAVVRMRVSMAGVIMIVTAVTMRMRTRVSVTGPGNGMRMDMSVSQSMAVYRLLLRAILPPGADQGTSLDPQQPRTERGNQPIADHLDPPDRAVHGAAGCAQKHGGNTHNRHRDNGLQNRRGKGQHHAAPPGLAIGDHIGRNHRLAVAGPSGVKHTVSERQPEQGPDRGAVRLGGTDRTRQAAIEFRLLGQQPADDAVGRRRGGPRRAEGVGLRESRVAHQRGRQRNRSRGADNDPDRLWRPAASQHFTPILLANCAPNGLFGSGRAKIDSLRDFTWLSSPSFTVEILHEAGAPFRVIGSFSANSKATK